jgi:putative sigma-54 modulation protein
MKINIRGKNKFVPTEAIRSYIDEKVGRIANYFTNSDDITANVLCKVYDEFHVIEVTIPTRNIILRAESKDDTMYGAIDRVVDKIETQLLRHRKRINTLIKKREGISDYFRTDLDSESYKNENEVNKIVKSKKFDLAVMTPDEAVTQMEMLDHDFFMFINEENHKVCVAYVREDGNYAIIEAKNL